MQDLNAHLEIALKKLFSRILALNIIQILRNNSNYEYIVLQYISIFENNTNNLTVLIYETWDSFLGGACVSKTSAESFWRVGGSACNCHGDVPAGAVGQGNRAPGRFFRRRHFNLQRWRLEKKKKKEHLPAGSRWVATLPPACCEMRTFAFSLHGHSDI
jgi:hypothetical protein